MGKATSVPEQVSPGACHPHLLGIRHRRLHSRLVYAALSSRENLSKAHPHRHGHAENPSDEVVGILLRHTRLHQGVKAVSGYVQTDGTLPLGSSCEQKGGIPYAVCIATGLRCCRQADG